MCECPASETKRGRVVLLQRPCPLRLREVIVERRLEGLHEAAHSFAPRGAYGRGNRVRGCRPQVPDVRLVAAEDEREHALRRKLAERESEPGSPGGAEEVRTVDAE